MKSIGLALFLISVALLMESCAPTGQESCGFIQNNFGERVSWKGQIPVKLYIHESVPANLRAGIASAAEVWNSAANRKLIEVQSSITVQGPLRPIQDGFNVVYFFQDGWDGDAREQARTTAYSIGDQIKEADVRVNGKFKYYLNSGNAGEINFEALLIHELGHVLGLKHQDAQPSVMAESLQPNNDRVELANYDVDSLKCEY